MVDVINFTDAGNISSIGGLVTHGASITNGMLGYGLIFVVGLITYMALSNQPKKSVFAATAFMMFLMASFMWMFNIITVDALYTLMAILAATIFILYFDKEG